MTDGIVFLYPSLVELFNKMLPTNYEFISLRKHQRSVKMKALNEEKRLSNLEKKLKEEPVVKKQRKCFKSHFLTDVVKELQKRLGDEFCFAKVKQNIENYQYSSVNVFFDDFLEKSNSDEAKIINSFKSGFFKIMVESNLLRITNKCKQIKEKLVEVDRILDSDDTYVLTNLTQFLYPPVPTILFKKFKERRTNIGTKEAVSLRDLSLKEIKNLKDELKLERVELEVELKENQDIQSFLNKSVFEWFR